METPSEESLVTEPPAQLAAPLPPSPRSTRSLTPTELAKRITHARVALAVVGVVSLGVVFFETIQLNKELDRYGVAFADIETMYHLLFVLAYAWGVGFLVLSFVAKRRPFGAAVTGLVMYAADLILGGLIEPENIWQGLIMKFLIIAALVRAVVAGREYAKVMREDAIEDAFR